jgi:hypothetical protein
MKKRTVHISEENVFYQVFERSKVSDMIDELKEKWDGRDFSKKVYFEKRATEVDNQGNKRGTIQFIRATKSKQ